MTATDELVGRNATYAASFSKGDLPAPPRMKVAVLTCMDARLDPTRALGLEEGDAHVIRNAGGVATADVIRSLVISQRLLGTEEIVLIHHTGCGLEALPAEELEAQILADTGQRPDFDLEAFSDAESDVRQTAARIRSNPFVPHTSAIRGFLYKVESGTLREVPLA